MLLKIGVCIVFIVLMMVCLVWYVFGKKRLLVKVKMWIFGGRLICEGILLWGIERGSGSLELVEFWVFGRDWIVVKICWSRIYMMLNFIVDVMFSLVEINRDI